MFFAVLFSALSAAAMERVETRRVPLADGGRVKVSTGSGDIKVVPGPGNRLELQLHIVSHEQKTQKARELLNRVELVMRRSDDTISVDVLDRKSGGTRLMQAKRLGLQFDLVVPENCSLDLYTQEGSIQVGNLKGNMRTITDRGRIFLGQIDGDVQAETQQGDVLVSRCSGSVDLKTQQGNVQVGTVSGHASLETKKGNIVVQSAYNSFTAYTLQGNIIASLARISGPVKLRSDMGNVQATLNPDENCLIAAKGTRGHISSEIPLVLAKGGKDSGRHIGELHGGGPRVEISASGGGKIRVLKGAPLFSESRS
ncbi:hypothetical protein AXK11_07600 [Cephaloticoccus primus]|uniref:DUF4097 domain-containing protein n=1 Tax=Cephaloticoccus primus TaxID=1548207 RepID=A0A139SJV6_9BACT|nr:hypothetical protein AXK11_07600 [Cephaloticoccus primus]